LGVVIGEPDPLLCLYRVAPQCVLSIAPDIIAVRESFFTSSFDGVSRLDRLNCRTLGRSPSRYERVPWSSLGFKTANVFFCKDNSLAHLFYACAKRWLVSSSANACFFRVFETVPDGPPFDGGVRDAFFSFSLF